MKKITAYVFAFIMLAAAVAHIVKPEIYEPMVPDFLPFQLANIFAIMTEAVIGIMLLIPKHRKYGGLAFTILMLIFLPIHVLDLFKEQPVIGSKLAAIIRLIVQFVFMYLGWWIYKNKGT